MNCLKYYYNHLPLPEKKIYESLERGMVSRANSIRVVGSGTLVKKIMPLVYLDNPQLFYVDNTKMSFMDGGVFCVVTPCYYKSPEQSRSIEVYLERIADRFIEEIKKKRLNNQMTVKYVHDFVIRNTTYAKENMISGQAAGDVSTIAGVFCNHRAVCKGIAMAEKWLLDLAGIPSAVIEGHVNENGFSKNPADFGMPEQNNHAWNLVCINDLWYHMDTTMDLGMSVSSQQISYDYFLRSDIVFQKIARYIRPEGMADIEKYSYFAGNHAALRNKDQLEQFINRCLRSKKKRIYFELHGALQQFSDEQICRYIKSAYMGNVQFRRNQKLNIYDFTLQ